MIASFLLVQPLDYRRVDDIPVSFSILFESPGVCGSKLRLHDTKNAREPGEPPKLREPYYTGCIQTGRNTRDSTGSRARQ